MSRMGKYSQGKQRLLEFFGKETYRTVDHDFDDAAQRFIQVFDQITFSKRYARAWLNDLKAFLKNSHDFAEMYNRAYVINESTGEKHPRSDLAAGSAKIHRDLLEKSILEVETKVQASVFSKIDEHTERMNQTKAIILERNTLRQQFDHYQAKMMDLKKKRDRVLSKGQRESLSAVEKYQRNQRKYDDSKRDYDTHNALCINKLREIWDERFSIIDPLYVQLLEFEKFAIAQIHIGLSTLLPATLSDRDIRFVEPQATFVTEQVYDELSATPGEPSPISAGTPYASSSGRPSVPPPSVPPPSTGPGARPKAPPPSVPPPSASPSGYAKPPPPSSLAAGMAAMQVGASHASSAAQNKAAPFLSNVQAQTIDREVSGEKIRSFLKPEQVCKVQYGDGQWYAAKIEGIESDGTFTVTYTEYGNQEVVNIDRIRIPASAMVPHPVARRLPLPSRRAPPPPSHPGEQTSQPGNPFL